MKVAAIVPALNEEANVGQVLRALLKSKELDEVVVVDGGSRDKTVEISRKMGAKVIKQEEGGGKGVGMKEGVEATEAEIIVFFDADLVGLTPEHVSLLVEPIFKNEAMMSVAVREGGGWRGRVSEFFIKIDSLSAIAGERAMKRSVFEKIPSKFIGGFMIETALNYYCKINRLTVKYVKLKGLNIIIKEKKWGLIRGLLNRLKMIWQLLKIRLLIIWARKEFKNV